MIGYDIDGVLADKPPAPAKPWGKSTGAERKARQQYLLDWYANAKALLQPTQPFIAISARKDTPEIRYITEKWIAQQPYGDLCFAVALLNRPRTIPNTADFKTQIINHYDLTRYIEDNYKILQRLNTPGTTLYYWDKTMSEPILFKNVE